ncbi:MAG: RnfABCDGE type electron transport complex subunit D [Planctomycetes bacterium]|nr:RnfABCDGE type electron transport complex subunit D [Planctomycetota bacterium]
MNAIATPHAPQMPGSVWSRIKPTHLLAGLNSLILIVAQWQFSILEGYSILMIAVAAAIACEIVASLIVREQFPNILNAYISGVSTTLLTRPAAGAWWPIVAVAVLSILSKYVLTWRGKHVWNPTNFGIALILLAAPNSATILGHEFGNTPWANGVIWFVGLIVVARARLLHITASYVLGFIAFAALRAVLNGGGFATELAPLTGPMYQLFIFFMVTDPPTAVVGRNKQIVVAFLVAACEALIRIGSDLEVPLLAPFSAAPAIFGLAIVGPIAKTIDLELAHRAKHVAGRVAASVGA